MEVLLRVGGFNVDRGVEMTVVNVDTNMGGEVFQVKWTG